jgi:chromosome segregation ATPase
MSRIKLDRPVITESAIAQLRADLKAANAINQQHQELNGKLRTDLERVTRERDEVQLEILRVRLVYEDYKRGWVELVEREQQTHEILGSVLGIDTSLEDAARRLTAQLEAARASLRELMDAMHRYEADVEPASPKKHREMMARVEAALGEQSDTKRLQQACDISDCRMTQVVAPAESKEK